LVSDGGFAYRGEKREYMRVSRKPWRRSGHARGGRTGATKGTTAAAAVREAASWFLAHACCLCVAVTSRAVTPTSHCERLAGT